MPGPNDANPFLPPGSTRASSDALVNPSYRLRYGLDSDAVERLFQSQRHAGATSSDPHRAAAGYAYGQGLNPTYAAWITDMANTVNFATREQRDIARNAAAQGAVDTAQGYTPPPPARRPPAAAGPGPVYGPEQPAKPPQTPRLGNGLSRPPQPIGTTEDGTSARPPRQPGAGTGTQTFDDGSEITTTDVLPAGRSVDALLPSQLPTRTGRTQTFTGPSAADTRFYHARNVARDATPGYNRPTDLSIRQAQVPGQDQASSQAQTDFLQGEPGTPGGPDVTGRTRRQQLAEEYGQSAGIMPDLFEPGGGGGGGFHFIPLF